VSAPASGHSQRTRSRSHARALLSDGARQSPRGESELLLVWSLVAKPGLVYARMSLRGRPAAGPASGQGLTSAAPAATAVAALLR
jgi:hypothetical protein